MTIKEHTIREVNIQYGRKKRTFQAKEAAGVSKELKKILPNNSQEHFVALYLDASHQALGWSVVTTGLADQCQIHPRELYQRAVMLGACAAIVAHNHPSGDTKPSTADDNTTKKLIEAGKILGITVLDHIIIGDDAHYSYQENAKI